MGLPLFPVVLENLISCGLYTISHLIFRAPCLDHNGVGNALWVAPHIFWSFIMVSVVVLETTIHFLFANRFFLIRCGGTQSAWSFVSQSQSSLQSVWSLFQCALDYLSLVQGVRAIPFSWYFPFGLSFLMYLHKSLIHKFPQCRVAQYCKLWISPI